MSSRGRTHAKDKALKVYRYFVRGLTMAEIATGEGIPLRTVYWLIEESRRITDGEMRLLNKAGVLRELFSQHRERKRALWLLFQSAKLEVVKVGCLKSLAEEDKRFEELAERMSLIEPKADLKTQHEIHITEQKELRIRVDVRYSDAELAGRFPDLLGRLR